jgi:hypothetical protein
MRNDSRKEENDMGNTREVLKKLGTQQSEEALVEAGKRTIADAVAQTLREKGISEAVGFDIVLKNGERITISSDSNPNLQRPASEVESINVRQSAKAGLVQLFVIR